MSPFKPVSLWLSSPLRFILSSLFSVISCFHNFIPYFPPSVLSFVFLQILQGLPEDVPHLMLGERKKNNDIENYFIAIVFSLIYILMLRPNPGYFLSVIPRIFIFTLLFLFFMPL